MPLAQEVHFLWLNHRSRGTGFSWRFFSSGTEVQLSAKGALCYHRIFGFSPCPVFIFFILPVVPHVTASRVSYPNQCHFLEACLVRGKSIVPPIDGSDACNYHLWNTFPHTVRVILSALITLWESEQFQGSSRIFSKNVCKRQDGASRIDIWVNKILLDTFKRVSDKIKVINAQISFWYRNWIFLIEEKQLEMKI